MSYPDKKIKFSKIFPVSTLKGSGLGPPTMKNNGFPPGKFALKRQKAAVLKASQGSGPLLAGIINEGSWDCLGKRAFRRWQDGN
jgi:hypothetical protein